MPCARSLPALAIALSLLACNTLFPPRPDIVWDTDPEAVIISATFCCGLMPMQFVENYIPDAQVRGDGRIIWVESDNTGGRRVLTGRLTSDEMTALLQRAVDDGFLGWEDSYADYSVTDQASQCLSINLASQSKSVCEYYRGAPHTFHALYDEVASGAGAEGADYTPDQGYLVAYPQAYAGYSPPKNVVHWSADSLGLSLKDATRGAWVEGEALDLAWRVVNTNSWGPVAQDGIDYYQISLRIPGVSMNPPPTPQP